MYFVNFLFGGVKAKGFYLLLYSIALRTLLKKPVSPVLS